MVDWHVINKPNIQLNKGKKLKDEQYKRMKDDRVNYCVVYQRRDYMLKKTSLGVFKIH